MDTQGQKRPLGELFDLPLAVALGDAAFTAYRVPKIVHNFEDVDVGDATVTLVDKSFLRDAFYGLLELSLRRAANLPDSDPIGAPDPYAVVSIQLRSLYARTRPYRFTAKESSANPVWDEKRPPMKFPVWNPQYDEVVIKVYDEDPGTDDDLGTATLKLRDLIGRGQQELSLPLEGSGRAMLQVVCRLVDMRQCPPQDLEALTAATGLQEEAQQPQEPEPGHKAGMSALSTVATMNTSREVVTAVIEATASEAAAAATKAAVANSTNNTRAANGTPQYKWADIKALLRSVVGGPAAPPPNVAAPPPSILWEDLTPVAFLECRDTETQAYVFRNVATRRVVVAFRGTDKLPDWTTNLNAVPTNPKDLLPITSKTASGAKPEEITVHRGFYGAYLSIRRTVLPLVESVINADGEPGRWRVYLTGHSLGGALAALAAYDLACRKWEREQLRQPGPNPLSLTIYTFGSPRVGNRAFATDYNALVPDAWRIANENDIVASVPFTNWDYFHGGIDVSPGPNGAPVFSDVEVEKSVLAKISSIRPVSSHVGAAYLQTMYAMALSRVQQQMVQPRSKL